MFDLFTQPPTPFFARCFLYTRPDVWRAYATHKTPYATPLPAPFHASLNSFQKLLVLRALREEKTVFAVRQFVLQQLGPAFTEPPPFDLEVGHRRSVLFLCRSRHLFSWAVQALRLNS